MTSLAMPVTRFPSPRAARPAKPSGNAASRAVRPTAVRGISVTRPIETLGMPRGGFSSARSGSPVASAPWVLRPLPARRPSGVTDLDRCPQGVWLTAIDVYKHFGRGVRGGGQRGGDGDRLGQLGA